MVIILNALLAGFSFSFALALVQYIDSKMSKLVLDVKSPNSSIIGLEVSLAGSNPIRDIKAEIVNENLSKETEEIFRENRFIKVFSKSGIKSFPPGQSLKLPFSDFETISKSNFRKREDFIEIKFTYTQNILFFIHAKRSQNILLDADSLYGFFRIEIQNINPIGMKAALDMELQNLIHLTAIEHKGTNIEHKDANIEYNQSFEEQVEKVIKRHCMKKYGSDQGVFVRRDSDNLLSARVGNSYFHLEYDESGASFSMTDETFDPDSKSIEGKQ